ncbi:MAG: formylglycine-generating enzyme family protein [Bacteroidales bacterium]|jgi:formylglycine-generating enzyme required for sulfatase activity|nr:formylglycine-generating enzyme family protein [Bacteroidales bacterium]
MKKLLLPLISLFLFTYCANVEEFKMVLVEGGSFSMGCDKTIDKECQKDEMPNHIVNLSDFYIGQYEITQKQWEWVMGDKHSEEAGDNYPVSAASFEEIQKFIIKLNTKTGKHYRLPTEAEWEYAARGGKNKDNYKYSGSDNINEVAWSRLNSNKKLQEVGKKKPNSLNIYDMSGNVWEFCADWYHENYYLTSPKEDPINHQHSFFRVLRGGSCLETDDRCRVSNRDGNPYDDYGNYGFRLAMDNYNK